MNVAVWTKDGLINVPLSAAEDWCWKFNRFRFKRYGKLTVVDGKGNVHAIIADVRSFRVSEAKAADQPPRPTCCEAGQRAYPAPCPWHAIRDDGLRSDGHAPNCDGWHHPISGHCGDCGCFTCLAER